MDSKKQGLVLCTQPIEGSRPTSRAARERAAKEYWDRLTPQQEGWVLRKMGFGSFGAVR